MNNSFVSVPAPAPVVGDLSRAILKIEIDEGDVVQVGESDNDQHHCIIKSPTSHRPPACHIEGMSTTAIEPFKKADGRGQKQNLKLHTGWMERDDVVANPGNDRPRFGQGTGPEKNPGKANEVKRAK